MATTKSIYILNGPNLNLLGTREPELYGRATLGDVESLCRTAAERHGLAVTFRQSNHEGALIDWIHEAGAQGAGGIIINPAAYTHTSVALRDALVSVSLPTIEVHLTNIFARGDSFRHHSFIAPVARASLCGFGVNGYALAIAGLAAMLGTNEA